MNKKTATLVSHIFEPLVVITVLGILAGFRAGLPTGLRETYFLFLGLLVIAPIVGFRLWFMRQQGMDWDMSDRKSRIKPLLIQIVLLLFNLVLVVRVWHNSVLTGFVIAFLFWLVGFALVTTKWKISGHAGIAAFGAGMIIFWYGWVWWPLLLVVPLVSWARVIRRDHTRAQVIVGSLYSWVIVYVSSVLLHIS